MSDPMTREEIYFAVLSGEPVAPPEPITRDEMYLAYLCGMDVNLPNPVTRKDHFMFILCQQGMNGGGGYTPITINGKTPDQNGNFVINTLSDAEIDQLTSALT